MLKAALIPEVTGFWQVRGSVAYYHLALHDGTQNTNLVSEATSRREAEYGSARLAATRSSFWKCSGSVNKAGGMISYQIEFRLVERARIGGYAASA